MPPRALHLLLAAGSTLFGLGLAELGLSHRDGGAFPHLNVYAPDPDLGARLLPGAEQRVAFGGNPVTSVRINAQGFRGADWGPPTPGEIAVVGDSQVFGLGVEEDQALPAALAAASGRPVLNAGVPTYGPLEYLAVIDRLLAERHPAMVVVVLNLSNDLFERERPNRDRHKVWDGWAVRAETMPDEAIDFPGRRWLFRQSHLVYAVRRWLHTPVDTADLGVPSEGGLGDLAGTPAGAPPTEPATVQQARSAPQQATAEASDAGSLPLPARVRLAAVERREADERLTHLLMELDPRWRKGDDRLAAEAVAAHNHPGDIVWQDEGESSRAVQVTAEMLRRGAELRRSAVPTLRAWLDDHPHSGRAEEVARALAQWDQTGATLTELASAVPEPEPVVESPLAPWIREARARCAAAGAELVVAALPLDVQVSENEWEKYGKPAQDMSGTRVLLTEIVESAERAGVRGVDLTDALAVAEPGAFLHADLHMSPIGTAAAGKALAAILAGPAPFALPGPGLAEGRSRLPTYDELALAPEIVVKGSTRNQCSTRQLREWLLVECQSSHTETYDEQGEPPTLHVETAPLETAWGRTRGATLLLMPLLPGREARVQFAWSKAEMPESAAADAPWRAGRRETLVVAWEEGQAQARFEPLTDPFTPDQHASPTKGCFDGGSGGYSWYNTERGCAASYATCQELRTCASGSGELPPICPASTVAIGSSGWCFALCDAARPCAEGVCTDWVGAGVCL